MQLFLGYQTRILLIVGFPANKNQERNIPPGAMLTKKNKKKTPTCTNRMRCPNSKGDPVSYRNPAVPPCTNSCCTLTCRNGAVWGPGTCDSYDFYCNFPWPGGRYFGKQLSIFRLYRVCRGPMNLEGMRSFFGAKTNLECTVGVVVAF